MVSANSMKLLPIKIYIANDARGDGATRRILATEMYDIGRSGRCRRVARWVPIALERLKDFPIASL